MVEALFWRNPLRMERPAFIQVIFMVIDCIGQLADDGSQTISLKKVLSADLLFWLERCVQNQRHWEIFIKLNGPSKVSDLLKLY